MKRSRSSHTSLVACTGLSRQDPAIAFWSTPWRILAAAGRPVRSFLGFAYTIRFVVVGVAIWQSLAAGSSAYGLHGREIAVVLALFLMLSYLMPRWQTAWEKLIVGTADRELLAHDLGPPMATFLRRSPQTPAVIDRTQLLDPPAQQMPRPRLVRT